MSLWTIREEWENGGFEKTLYSFGKEFKSKSSKVVSSMVTFWRFLSARFLRSLAAVAESGSRAITSAQRLERALVMTPEPAPISRTMSRFLILL